MIAHHAIHFVGQTILYIHRIYIHIYYLHNISRMQILKCISHFKNESIHPTWLAICVASTTYVFSSSFTLQSSLHHRQRSSVSLIYVFFFMHSTHINLHIIYERVDGYPSFIYVFISCRSFFFSLFRNTIAGHKN